MAGAGKEWTNPNLDLKDFIGTKFTTAPDGKLYQLPDQQFANVLVPRRLVRAPGPEGQVQGQVRLRAGRADQLVRL